MSQPLRVRSVVIVLGFVALVTVGPMGRLTVAAEGSTPCVKILHREITKTASPFYKAIYADATDNRLITENRQSDDHGASWQTLRSHQIFAQGLPYGYRRHPVTAMLDPKHNRVLSIVNALDTPDLDPKISEPPLAQKNYYLRYRVSTDGGRTWLCDEPLTAGGDYNAQHPFADLWIGKNAIYLGDLGCRPIATQKGRVLVPAQMTVVDSPGELHQPPGALTYTEAVVLIGEWTADHRLTWRMSQRVKGNDDLSCRGMIEPTIAETMDGRIVMIMRGSNAHDANVAARKWISVSADQGETWSSPQAWQYDDGTSFYSPSSMSSLIRHRSGRIFWVGNISPNNAHGNSPRFPLVIGELDPASLALKRSSVVTLDDESDADRKRGRLDLSHVHLLELRPAGELMVTYVRGLNQYKSREFVLLRLAPSGE